MKSLLRRYLSDENGASAIEYSLLACIMAAALLAAWPPFYEGFMASWTNAGSYIARAVK